MIPKNILLLDGQIGQKQELKKKVKICAMKALDFIWATKW